MKTCLTLFFFFLFPLVFGQYDDPKFGKIDPAELRMTRYDKDTTADALMLFDNGNTKFMLDSEHQFQFVFERHCRIKIFKKSAFHLADCRLKLYKNGSAKEKLSTLKAVTYNLVDGKIVKTKLDNDNVFEETSNYYIIKNFAFPQVKEGSVVELSYTITSDFLYNLRGWNFQYEYPAVWSQYTTEIPEYFKYRQSSTGYLPFDVQTSEQIPVTFLVHVESQNDVDGGLQGSGRISAQNYEMKANATRQVLATKDVPAFIAEPNTDCDENYIQSMEFELSSIQYPNQLSKDYTQSWESVNEKMNSDEDFGHLLKSKGFISDTVENLIKGKSSDLDKASAIYSFVQSRMKWTGVYSLWSVNGLKKPFQAHSGNSSEINLLLTLMLQTAGLKADPVIFSTRDNGAAASFYPTITKFNSVLARLDVEGKQYFLDATCEFCPMGTLPANDINGKGRVVNNETGDWADLDVPGRYKMTKQYLLTLSPDGKFTGVVKGKYDGYAGISYRNHLKDEKTADDYFRKLQENLKGLNITGYGISQKGNVNESLMDSVKVEITDHSEILGDKILFQPLLYEAIEKNIYILEDRKYPVNYNYPVSETLVFSYKIPEGYKVESMPAPTILKFQDKAMVVSYNVQNVGDQLIVNYKTVINKILYIPDEYKDLKEFYNHIVKINSENVILKKTI